ncbi:diguanylate cyclase domain-containing protein [Aliidiomarina haloalkalitolerans]|uniref:diguanylate cyclase n=1 Tax=Aliidiomarina haloalkalitolerans TaxID=859059 RepID=A0A432VUM9_9GAMM|nr:sensor domain-containing diguanylate cyclase [Aliidiomarina haloalkalitolerans]RUO20182.1 hypothetical protein CWE06_06030 [Aliidiomarina haloalkalitolerans]
MINQTLNPQQLQYFFEQLWKQSLNPIWVCKVVPNDFEMVSANEAAMRVDANQIPGALISEILEKGGHAPELISGYFACLETKQMVEFEQRPWVNGKEYLYRTLLVPIINEHGEITHIWGTAHNLTDFLDPQKELLAINQILETKITERTKQLRDAMEKLEQLSDTDELTGLANRRHFNRHLHALMNAGRPFAILFIDIDYFKRYNDHFGHQAGDACLRQVAECLQQFQRQPDDLLSRYGGEEFVMLLPDCPLHEAKEIADAMRSAIHDKRIPHPTNRVPNVDYLTISVGLTLSPAGNHDPDTVLKAADDALYEAKETGRDRVYMIELTSN